MSSAADTLVSRSAEQASAAEPTTPATFGPSSLESWASYDQATRSWRTWQITFLSDLETFLETFPTSGMMRNGRLYRRALLVPHIHVTACSLLPTLAASENKDITKARVLAKLGMRDCGDGGRVARRICANSPTLHSSEESVGLNPSFGEWMMGFPSRHTALDSTPSATPSSRKSRKSSAGDSSPSTPTVPPPAEGRNRE